MFVRLAAAAVALALVATGCGGSSRRHAVAQYVDSVNVIQGELAAPLLEVSKANRDFAKPHSNPAAIERRLRKSATAIDRDARRLAALEAPVEARRLRSLLLQLAQREAALAREVAGFAAFLPTFQATLRPLAPAGAALKKALAKKGTRAAKAAALETYGSTLSAVLERLGRLSPPPVSLPVYTTQLATLKRVRVDLRRAGARASREAQQRPAAAPARLQRGGGRQPEPGRPARADRRRASVRRPDPRPGHARDPNQPRTVSAPEKPDAICPKNPEWGIKLSSFRLEILSRLA